ncbi:C6 domain-containing protein [Caenorhabditis elegans]|uniref:C6 domain-containing protein n=1 Tax=Caenorhabditis elegans TaxID=6239 RepID=Q17956_CAEEL|nr:C6 domain-containing protein [Caenorhabditis elegans]CAA90113.1 C6 domain-containing protein [Caenorhabditis elegans]|eukprot:NP_496288.1 Uncharacterized protein CELE_C14A4.9 [Caenorhabditis elegans]
MISAVVLFISAITVSNACVPTSTPTTTTPCCSMLSQSTLPRRNPTITTQQQCSVLQRVSSTCPVDGIVICAAAQETNPDNILIEFINSAGVVVRSANAAGSPATILSVKVVCINGVWKVPTTSAGTTYADIATVSCSQSGSTGTDLGYVMGTAV